jgi:hypothetical protein
VAHKIKPTKPKRKYTQNPRAKHLKTHKGSL